MSGEWLRSTVLGIIVLGAAGSLLAILLIRLARLFLGRLIRPAVRKLAIRVLAYTLRNQFKSGFMHGYAEGTANLLPMITLGVYRMLQCQVGIAAASVAVVVGVVAALTTAGRSFYLILFGCSVVFFTSSYLFGINAFYIWADYFGSARPILKKADKAADAPEKKATQ